MDSKFRVEKQELDVTITMADGSVTLGSVFLSPHSKLHGRRQTLEELLEESATFLPLNSSEGDFFLSGKAGISVIRSKQMGDEPELQFTRRVPAKLRMEGIGELEGDLIVPEGHASFRVSDYLNGEPHWLRLESEQDVYWVRKNSVLEIYL